MYKFLIFCFFLVANLYVAQSLSVWNIFDTVQKGVLIAAHRGDFKNYPENSIPGILSCITQGVDIVEIDVQKTSDGHFVLMHDPKLNRTTNGNAGDVLKLKSFVYRTSRVTGGSTDPLPGGKIIS